MNVICPYCNKPAELVAGDVVYKNRSDLSNLKFWVCRPCDARVGTHKDSKDHKPFGELANAELRKYRSLAHKAFDPLWEKKQKRDNIKVYEARNSGYKWLSKQLGVKPKQCHIGKADAEMCKKIIAICEPYIGRK